MSCLWLYSSVFQKKYNHSFLFIVWFLGSVVINILLINPTWAASVEDGMKAVNEGKSAFVRSDFETAVKKFELAVTIFQSNEYFDGLIPAYKNLATAYLRVNQPIKALNIFEKIRPIYEQLNDLESELYIIANIGEAHKQLERFQDALVAYNSALKLVKEAKDRKTEGIILREIATVYQMMKQHENVVDTYEQLLPIIREFGDKRTEGIVFTELGSAYWYLAKYTEAFQAFQQALQISREGGDKNYEFKLLIKMGGLYAELNQYQESVRIYHQAVDLAKEAQNKELEAAILGEIGVLYKNYGEYRHALEYFQETATIHQELDDAKGLSKDLLYLGEICNALGNGQQALYFFEHALVLKEELKDEIGQAAALRGIGVAHDTLHQHWKALGAFKRTLVIFENLANKPGEGQVLDDLGLVYYMLGQYQQALNAYEQSLKIAKELNDKYGEGVTLGHIGTIYDDLGLYTKAVEYYQQAETILQQVGDTRMESANLTNLAVVHTRMGEYEKALDYLERSISLKTKVSLPTRAAEINKGNVYLEMGRLSEALKIFKKFNEVAGLGRIALLQSNYKAAYEYFQKGLREGFTGGSTELLFIEYVGLGRASEGMEDFQNARIYYQKAVDIVEEMRETSPPAQRILFFDVKLNGFSRLEPYEGLIRIHSQLKEFDSAFSYSEHTKARVFAESIVARHETLTFHLPEEVIKREKELASDLIALYSSRDEAYSKDPMEEVNATEEKLLPMRTFEFVGDTMVESNLHQFFGERYIEEVKEQQREFISKLREDYPEYAALKYPQPVSASEIPLKDAEYLLEYEVTETATILWLLHAGKIMSSSSIPIGREDLTTSIKQYRSYFEISSSNDLKNFDPFVSHQLYELLLADVLHSVPQGAHLIIVPDEILGIMPFESLVAKKPLESQRDISSFPHFQYVGDMYYISYIQSGTTLAITRNLPQKAITSKNMLIVADPVYNVDDIRVTTEKETATIGTYQQNILMNIEQDEGLPVFKRLRGTTELAQKLAKLFSSTDILEGFAATTAGFFGHSPETYTYIVFATHGLLDSQFPGLQEPALMLTQFNTLQEDDGFLTLTEVMDIELNAKCSALIACQTGLGHTVSGEGVMGLGRAFQYAGSKSVLVSLWSTEEYASIQLAQHFFSYLQEGKSAQEALYLARTDVREAGYEHPFYWAPFILIGDTE